MATGGEPSEGSMSEQGPDMECPVCMQLYQDPKVLQCGHSICDSCVRQLADDGHSFYVQSTLLCPVCRTVCPVEGALPTNYALLGVIDEHRTRKESMKCEQCGERAKIAHVWLCRTCASLTICAGCAMKSHREDGHEMEAGDMLIKRQRDEISDWKQKFAERVASLDEKKEEITGKMTQLEGKLMAVTTELDVARVFRPVKTDLQEKINAFKQKLDSLGIGGVGRGSLGLSSFSTELQENEKELLKWNEAQNQFLASMDSVFESVEKLSKDLETTKAALAQFAESLGLQMDDGGAEAAAAAAAEEEGFFGIQFGDVEEYLTPTWREMGLGRGYAAGAPRGRRMQPRLPTPRRGGRGFSVPRRGVGIGRGIDPHFHGLRRDI